MTSAEFSDFYLRQQVYILQLSSPVPANEFKHGQYSQVTILKVVERGFCEVRFGLGSHLEANYHWTIIIGQFTLDHLHWTIYIG